VSVPERDTIPTLPGLKMLPGMMPILQAPAVITPGQFGPTSRDLEPASERFTFTMSATGMPSVMQTISGNFRIDRFRDRVGRRRAAARRSRSRRSRSLAFASIDGVEHRQAEMGRAAFARAPCRRPSSCRRRSPASEWKVPFLR
jgi:hypothetical protein